MPAKVKQEIHEGNIRRVVIKQGLCGRRVLLTAAAARTLLAPVLAAIGSGIALCKYGSIELETAVSVPEMASAGISFSPE